MADQQALARAVLARLMSDMQNGRPDGRPLHAYRFSRDDFDLTREALLQMGRPALTTLEGSAVFVAFTAEWFRRDRVGGHWDWKRPLREIGQIYGQNDATATLTYTQLAWALETGLRWWGRPPPPDGDRIVAIVKEAGFPAAALRDNRRVTDWLRNAVRLMEQGFEASDAVGSEAWRMNARKVAEATFSAAVELCESLVALRQLVRSQGQPGSDPIVVLDAAQPDWRAHLPFELEPQDVASVIEILIRAPLEAASALMATRRLHRKGQDWCATATIGLTGRLDLRRLSPRVVDALGSAMRMRVVPRGELIGSIGALAALERGGDDDETDPCWVMRPLVTGFEPRIGLDTEIRLGAVVGDELVDEFPAYAGESYEGEVVVFEPVGVEDGPEDCKELVALGCSSVRSKKPFLALAAPEATLAQIAFDEDRWDLGGCDGRRVIGFTGSAKLNSDDGAVFSWRAAADRSEAPRVFLVGATMRRPRETVYRGLPSVWLDDGDIQRECPRKDVRWRPIGRGVWRRSDEGIPYGRIALGAFNRSGELIATVKAVVAPPSLELTPVRVRKGLLLENVAGGAVIAQAGVPLTVREEPAGTFVDLEGVEPGRTVELTLAWDASATISLVNPVTSEALITPSGCVAPRHKVLSIGKLHGYRAVTAEPGRLCFELVAKHGHHRSFTRRVHGEAPLVSYLDDLRNLLGSSDELDASVRLSWIGGQDWACEIRWYDLDPGDYAEAEACAFRGSRLAMLGIQTVSGLAVADPSKEIATTSGAAGLSERLRAALGPAPWLVWGDDQNGRVLRPRVLDDGVGRPGRKSPLVEAIDTRNASDRFNRLADVAADPASWSPEDRRRWLDLLVTASKAHLPYAALDPLRVLARRPAAAIWLLAFAEDGDEQRAVLAVQRELPFLWACTSAPLWVDAFEARANDLDAHLASIGVDTAFGSSLLLTALEQIADQAPDLSARLRTVLLVLFGGGRRPCRGGAYEALATRLHRMASGATLAERTNMFVQRHVDGPPPPRGLNLAERTPRARDLVRRFEPGFEDVVAAPVAAATAAFALEGLDPAAFEACRAAWLFDPEHFDGAAGCLVAEWAARGGPPPLLETTN